MLWALMMVYPSWFFFDEGLAEHLDQDSKQTVLKIGPTPALLLFIFGLFKQIKLQFLQQYMSIQYMLPGFEPLTWGTRVSSHNH